MPFFGVPLRNGVPLGLGSVVGFGAVQSLPPEKLFAAGEQGLWYDFTDFGTLFQDAAGTTPVTALEQSVGLVLDKSGRGNNASQSTLAARPVLSARYNLFVGTSTLATQSVTTVATSYTLRFSGAGSITLSGTATGTYSAGSHTVVCTAGTLTATVTGAVTDADIRPTNDGVGLPTYQRVTTATDYDSANFPIYLRFNGSDSGLLTALIDFTGSDKVTVFAGLRKLSDGLRGSLVELGTGAVGTNSFAIEAPATNATANFRWRTAGSITVDITPTGFAAPLTSVLTGIGDIANDISILRVNAVQAATSSADQGTGAYSNRAVYIGRRGGTTLPFNGRLYSLIICGAAPSAAQITQTETWVNSRTAAY